MIIPEEISVGNVLDYLTSEGDWMPAVMDWQGIKWLTEDPKGFNAVHRPRVVTDYELNFNFDFIQKIPCPYMIGPNGDIPVNHVHQVQNYFALITNTFLPWKTL